MGKMTLGNAKFTSVFAVTLLTLLAFVPSSIAFGVDAPMKVIVTGAAGRTGKLVFSSLNKDNRFQAVGLVRTEKSAKKLVKTTKCGLDHVVVSDVTKLLSDEDEEVSSIPKGLDGAEAIVICTSAVPAISKTSVVKAMLKIPLNLVRGKKAFNFRDLKFVYKPGQYPEKVDYEGQKAQIDLAKNLGMRQIVIVSSMGGTDPSNFLNSIGKDKDGNGNGDILLWKRKAEKYLIEETGLEYTIIHPGGLRKPADKPEELILDVDDKLLKNEKRSISREDVAQLCMAALTVGRGKKVSFDCIAREVDEGKAVKSAEEALTEFLETGKTADYSL
eukprot:CAMPEP_0185726572 /NCGR_PEP_ID=MMETSP1171-20130828/2512_1 /TAXON_ID=374046 /ORGANISM="Helicotheca tamensis, Strain CCMP826" /LENGTH=329 /DNA_ID=CAMNT_0028394955 /DNA_START=44 /DNA_END=1033 /DNA_ORIENTATION=-